ncbi:MAG: DUF2971 domain-containing protein [Kiritimatiellales bacterium]
MDLYFYTDLESEFHRQRVLALLDGKLILSDPLSFNDPFDSKLNMCHDDTEQAVAKEMEEKRGSNLSYIQNENSCRAELESRRENVFKDYRMFCFSENWDSLLMWAHYARSHKGLCLKIRVDPDALSRPKDILSPVRYTTHYPEISGEDIAVKNDDALKTLLLTKSVDWLYEKEWRYITSYFACSRDSGCSSRYDHVDARSFLEVKEAYLGVKFGDLSCMRNVFGSVYGVCSGETVFDLLEQGAESELDKLSQRSGEHRDAIDRERVLMALRKKKILLFECKKGSATFSLNLQPLEYSRCMSLDVGCLNVGRKQVHV